MLLLLLAMVAACGPTAVTAAPPPVWPPFAYSEVRACAYNSAGNNDLSILLPDGSLDPSTLDRDGVLLRPEQAERLVAAVSGAHPECPVGFCYAPQHAFVFYDAAKRPVARVEVCFHCFAHQAQPMIANGRVPADWLALFELCADLRLPLTPGEEFKRLYTERLTRRSSERALRAALLRKPCPTAAVPVAEFISVNITRLSSIRRPPPRRFLHPAPLRVPCCRGGKGAWKGLLGAKKCGFLDGPV